MEQAGLSQCIGDLGCFKNNRAIISTHVDDMLACGLNEELNKIEQAIKQKVELDKLGLPTKLLGLELSWANDKKTVKLTQTNAIERLVKEHGITNEVPTRSFPLQPESYEVEGKKLQPAQATKYQSLVRSLLYINRCTRPNISIHIDLLGSRTSDASHRNLQTTLQLLRYLASTKTEGIPLTQNTTERIIAYADTLYGREGAKSQSGNLLTLNGNIIMCSSRKQDVIAQLITEAKYIACSEGAKDTRWLQQFLNEIEPEREVLLYTDNEAAIRLTKSQTFYRRGRETLPPRGAPWELPLEC